ncbi:MAG: asparaginase [Candidatus Sericytochromatia bacterium]
MDTWVPLVEYKRNGIAECIIHGAVSWVSGKNLIYSWGGNVVCYGRSMMKPLMMKVFAKELDSILNWEQKAICISSHNGDTEHIRAMKSILNESEMSLMQTPHALPLMQFGKQRRRPRRYYHPCSGEYAGILRGCLLKGWPRVGYTLPHHPLNLTYLENLKKYLGQDWKPEVIAKDGCGLPTISMTVTQLATMYASLVTEKNDDWIWDAFINNPDLIGGFNRLDSTIIKSCNGKVIAKEGADGLLGLGILHPDYPDGLGIVIKIAHGWDTQATWYVARYVLGVLGFDFRNPYPLERQKAYIIENVIPPNLRDRISTIQPWDDWDPDRDRWEFDVNNYIYT